MDSEARDIWAQFLPEDHILLGNKHDNFWEMGETGPCGPCSEIHIDLRSDDERAKVPGRDLVNKDHHLVIEIWNLVFMQFNRKAGGELERLPKQHVDTGMGFERLCMAIQGKQSNYDTDVFTNMIHAISALCGKPYVPDSDEGIAMRVIADHIRAIAFSITDGQLPSNVKAGYVIRRILRRAVRYGYTFLDLKSPFLCRLVPQLVDDMGEAFPEIKAQQTLVEKVIHEEEEAFLRTLDKGIKLMDDILEKSASTKVISGKDAFLLYDTYGFPIDLSELIAREKGYTIDMKEFEVELGKQKERARNATANSFGDWTVYHEGDRVEFTGYDNTEISGALLLKQRTVVQKNKEMLQLVFDRTPFYGEMGGEIGDTGTITSADGETIRIINTVKENDLTVHIAERLPQNPEGEFTLSVDAPRRQRIANNHTCTHLMHRALREILGTHVEQKGSYVSDKGFRFDFSHFEKLSDEQVTAVEKRVNELIRSNFPLVEKREATMDEARSEGAMALFGEKYGDKVRVVRFGPSVELCGGCHTSYTGNIGMFKIMSESAIAAGVRRIEAITGEEVENYVNTLQNAIRTARSFFNNVPDLTGAIHKMIEENAGLKKQAEEFAKAKAAEFARELKNIATDVNGINLIVAKAGADVDATMLRNAALLLQKQIRNTALVSAYEAGGKPQLMLMYSDDLVAAGKHAGKQIGEAAKLIQGGGGGQPGLATAGGKDIAGLDAAEKKLIELATA
jgi:alanyl-tRNA synthetase